MRRLSRCLGPWGTRHPAVWRGSAETAGETPGLKALARLVLTRDSRRDAERDRVSRPSPRIDARRETVSAAECPLASWGDVEEESAAIVERDGGIPRAWTEGFARLRPDHPPGDVPAKRWLTFIDDVGRFLDSPFCAVAAALGWGPHDLFGCDRDRPFARIDHAGLLWLLNGDRLVALTANAAIIERRTGARQTFRRRPVAVGEIVLAWELVANQ
jgi:hypothetical protein